MKWKITSYFLSLIFNLSLYANFETHLKPASNKAHYHTIRNVDFIYMINLDQRPEKFQKSQGELDQYGIYPYRFSAVNGWELTLNDINDMGVVYKPGKLRKVLSTCYPLDRNFEVRHEIPCHTGVTYYSHSMPRGSIGIVLSHLSILKDAYESGYETIWVMEDDIHIVKDPHEVSDLIDELDGLVGKEGWDILFTDRDTIANSGKEVPCMAFAPRPNYMPRNPRKYELRQQVSSTFRRIGARYGAYSMIVRRSGMKKILDFYQKYDIYLPYDMDIFLIDDMNLFTVLENVVTTRLFAESDNGQQGYQSK